MGNAAKNLVPVTLELGGKSPVIISHTADLNKTAFNLAAGKICNGGQVCINPDLVYVPKAQLESFLDALRSAYRDLNPTVAGNPDVVAVVNQRHLERVEGLVQDARPSSSAASGDRSGPGQPDHARGNLRPGDGRAQL
jgi:coniferyl-aldehyde dehydrogenase